MGKGLTNKEKINAILNESNRMLSFKEIEEKCQEKEIYNIGGKTPYKTIGSIFYTDDEDLYKKNNEKPFKVGLKSKTYDNENEHDNNNQNIEESDDIENTNKDKNGKKYDERDLHKFLVAFMRSKDGENAVYCKTIFHEGSKKDKKGSLKWLHPDIVGVRFILDKYKSNATKVLIKNNSIYLYEFYSFEMKTRISTSLLSDAFFQAVANSSWANYGYLVAAEIDDDFELQEKMRRLNNKFGIGIIKLDLEHYAQSEVVLDARYNEDIDYDTIDKLIEKNKDFKEFIEKCDEYNRTGKEYKKFFLENSFDKFYKDEDEAYKNINNKN